MGLGSLKVSPQKVFRRISVSKLNTQKTGLKKYSGVISVTTE
jgi:hypothetical protein